MEPENYSSPAKNDLTRLINHLPQAGDPVLTVLKGHLLLEELLRKLIDSKLSRPSILDGAKLDFDQCLFLAQALTGESHADWVWIALKKINKIRNKMAHNLMPTGVDDQIADFIKFVYANGAVPTEDVEKKFWPLNAAIAGLFISFAIFFRLEVFSD